MSHGDLFFRGEEIICKESALVLHTYDDLLTTNVETKIPLDHLAIGRRGNPEGYMPYFNFGCKYDRIGNGYEEQDDLLAEADEFRQVIDALLMVNAINK